MMAMTVRSSGRVKAAFREEADFRARLRDPGEDAGVQNQDGGVQNLDARVQDPDAGVQDLNSGAL